MKKTIWSMLLLLAAFCQMDTNAQNLTQANYTSVVLPQITGSGTSNRLPLIWRATIKNLSAGKTYRYYTQAAKFSDLGTTNTGAGNTLIMNPDSANFVYTTSPGIKTAGTYGIFKTDASGTYTGWFGLVYTSNARFTAGNYVIPAICIAEDTSIVAKYALDDSVYVTSFGSAAADTNATGIWGKSSGTARNMVLLFDNISATGKPISIACMEDDGTTISSIVKFYSDSVNAKAGRWGTLICNKNANGVQRIEQRALATGAVVSYQTASAGVWSGVSTVNPAGGLTAIKIDSVDFTVPVELTSFSASVKNGVAVLGWRTATETNNYGFDIEKKTVNGSYSKIGFIGGNGTTTSPQSYTFTDNNLNSACYYRLKQIDYDGSYKYSNEIYLAGNTVNNFVLNQNYPNPFNPETIISYELPSAQQVTLKIYNTLGKEIAVLVNQKQEKGSYSIHFKMPENITSSGVYVYKLQAGSSSVSKKMMYLK